MRLRLYKMGLEGKVAVGNLLLLGLVLAAQIIAFPSGVIDVDRTSPSILRLVSLIELAEGILTFPLNVMIMVTTPMSGPPITAVIFVPLNAYLWGYVAAAIITRRRLRGGHSGKAHGGDRERAGVMERGP